MRRRGGRAAIEDSEGVLSTYGLDGCDTGVFERHSSASKLKSEEEREWKRAPPAPPAPKVAGISGAAEPEAEPRQTSATRARERPQPSRNKGHLVVQYVSTRSLFARGFGSGSIF